ncbi:hypothetical protein ACFRFJ_30060 [Streptomyces hydrogenans]|uniref:hypothetical protein n=1 Tax=Streptomyces hydrogenans TaxID=1873719 RepID=UPI00367EE541
MAGTRTSITELLKNAAVGTEVDPEQQTVRSSPGAEAPQPEAEAPQPDNSRQVDENTNSLPTVFVPPSATDPAERLAYCEGAILHADRETDLATERITQQYLLWVGEPYRIVRDEELFRKAGYPTFDAWGRALNGHGGDYMGKVIRIAPVVRALSSVTRRQLKEQPLRPLVSVQREHGDEAVRECWRRAEASGNLTERGLRHAAVALGYKIAPEPAASVPTPRPLTPSTLLNVGRIKRLVSSDPAQARTLLQGLRHEIDALERDLASAASAEASQK